ncbi:LANO_0B04456g1_1 [Lachancea nothofagi CBS 11611]|uniref:LANO_0B04456g1_1 n=1 Tax=Lachancea nothofagi CBS 11611 TaxID=1266666 RepID=A0A1G4IXL9_9SACH|nr:LANO_0B04456g1_1 [Lachancea nothofagi CBS 11611]
MQGQENLLRHQGLHLEALLGILGTQMDAGLWSDCKIRMLNAGNLSLQESAGSPHQQYYSHSATYFIKCPNNSSDGYTALVDILNHNATSLLGNTIPRILGKNNQFIDGNLVVAFVLCAVSVGSWMLLLVLLLLPANNHNSRKKMVYLGVAYSAIFHTVIISISMSSIFEKQYAKNYQSSKEYNDRMLNSTLYNVMLFFGSIISNLNWLDIVYYMFHNYRKTKNNWVPRLLNNKNRQILTVGLSLTCAQTLLMGFKLWSAHRANKTIAILLRTIDFIIYTLFTLSLMCYVWRNFRFTLVPRRRGQRLSWRALFLFFWNDYHETLLLLAYNAVVIAILYSCTIILMTMTLEVSNWMGSLLAFLNVLVTVNTWGLIGVLERRERTFSKETVLGRKINNKDRFFVDPNINYGTDDNFCLGEDSTGARDVSLKPKSKLRRHGNKRLNIIKKPARALKSKLLTSKRKDEAVADHQSFMSDADGGRGSTQFHNDPQDCERVHDNESTETLLTRNYIFNHDG